MPDLGVGIPNPVQAGIGLAETVAGFINKGKAKKEAAYLQSIRPKYQENGNIRDQLSLAKSELSNGLGAEAENAYTQQTDRDLSTSLDSILKGGGSVNNVADVFDSSQMGRSRLAIMKENMRMQQINNLVSVQNNQAEEDRKAFDFNTYRPWADKAQANASARQGAESQIWSGLSTVAGSAMRPQQYPEQQSDPAFMGYSGGYSTPQTRQPNYSVGNTGNIPLPNGPSINM